MKEKIKKKWVKTLLSTDYEQGTFGLRDLNNKYCCLGVLCDLYVKKHKTEKWEKDTKNSYFINNVATVLPPEVRTWSGLKNAVIENDLINMNDGAKDSFEEIAVFIEKEL